MGLTHQSCGSGVNKEVFRNGYQNTAQYNVALLGNPNTGKSTLFNALTGLKQHTGNWPGKTVLRAEGKYSYQNLIYNLIDLPGTYSLLANSPEEQVAREYLCFGRPDAVVVVVDATCLERNLNLVLQVLEITPRVVVCVNLMDEAARKSIFVDTDLLSQELGVPAVPTVARDGLGIDQLLGKVCDIARGALQTKPYIIRYDHLIESSVQQLESPIKDLVGERFNSRWLALRLLEKDETVISALWQWVGDHTPLNLKARGEILT